MLTLKKLFYYSNKFLNLNDVIVLELLKQASPPIKISNLLSTTNLNIKQRQFRNILIKLEKQNFLTKFKLNHGLYFAFSFIKNTKCNKLHIKKPTTANTNEIKFKNLTYYCQKSYLLNNIYKIKRNDNVINLINNKNYIEEEITLKTQHAFVVNKNNYNYIKSLKEKFKKDFPTKNAYINHQLPTNFDYNVLKEKIMQSEFLQNKNNLGFDWFISHYDAIVNDYYKTIKNNFIFNKSYNGFSERVYSEEFFNSLYD